MPWPPASQLTDLKPQRTAKEGGKKAAESIDWPFDQDGRACSLLRPKEQAEHVRSGTSITSGPGPGQRRSLPCFATPAPFLSSPLLSSPCRCPACDQSMGPEGTGRSATAIRLRLRGTVRGYCYYRVVLRTRASLSGANGIDTNGYRPFRIIFYIFFSDS